MKGKVVATLILQTGPLESQKEDLVLEIVETESRWRLDALIRRLGD